MASGAGAAVRASKGSSLNAASRAAAARIWRDSTDSLPVDASDARMNAGAGCTTDAFASFWPANVFQARLP